MPIGARIGAYFLYSFDKGLLVLTFCIHSTGLLVRVPGVEGHACACVSKASRTGDHAASKAVIRKKSIKDQCMHRTLQSKPCGTREGMFTSTRAAVRRPGSICPQKGESAGRIARCEGPDLLLPSRESAAAVVWAVAGRSGAEAFFFLLSCL